MDEMISVKEAEGIIARSIVRGPQELVGLDEGLGRVLRESVRADRDLPPFDRSTFDGIAIDRSVIDCGQRTFLLEGIVCAGDPRRSLSRPEAALEIMTGASVPKGANCVVKSEDLVIEGGRASISDGLSLPDGHGIHPRASDCRKGDELLPAGTALSAKELSIAASVGQSQLLVNALPRIALVTTGDELVPVESTPEPHQIRRSNDAALAAALQSSGYERISQTHLPDDEAAIEKAIKAILEATDFLIFAGGVSKGKKDFVPEVLAKLGVIERFHWVSQRPGKPLWFGDFAATDDAGVAVFGLPGNPVSCFTCLHRYVIPALYLWSGRPPARRLAAKLRRPFGFGPPLTFLVPTMLECDESGQLWAEPLPPNTSGDYVSVARTDGFLQLPLGPADLPAGTPLPYFPWKTS